MSWTNGEVTVGDIGKGTWQFTELLHVTGPDTPLPGGGVSSPNTTDLTYSYGAGTWGLGTWKAYGPRVGEDGEILSEEVEVYGDRYLMYLAIHQEEKPCLPTPGWLLRLADSRMKLLPQPPAV